MLNLIPPPTHGFWKSFITFAAETSCFLTSTELDCGLESSSFLFFQSNLAYSEKDPRVRLLSVYLSVSDKTINFTAISPDTAEALEIACEAPATVLGDFFLF